jgi:hypothetical protein
MSSPDSHSHSSKDPAAADTPPAPAGTPPAETDLDWNNDMVRAGRVEAPSHPRQTTDLIEKMRQLTEKLATDGTTRGDLKILSRTLTELRYAFKVFTPYRAIRKVTVFGSARTPADAPSYLQTVQFGQAMAAHGWMVVTGGASGIMEAGHVGAGRENSLGLNILLPFEQSANPVIAGDRKLVYMKYFFTRKLMFVKESDAMCLLPGGFGTLDEGLEVLTLLQTGKRDMVPVVLLDEPGGSYWQEFMQFVHRQLLGRRMISPADLHLLRLTDRVEEAVDEVLQFFRVYHSMRYVHRLLVLRLLRPPTEELLAQLNAQFADILLDGAITLSGALPEEKEEAALADLPRLVLHFNRRSFGRLRHLIDCLNRGAV